MKLSRAAADSTRDAGTTGAGIDKKGPEVLAISFDGYCDGVTLTNPSTGNGEKRSVEAVSNGCTEGLSLIGSKGNVQGVAQSYAISGRPEDAHVQLMVSRNGTWCAYGIDGDRLMLLAEGTWTEGAPPASAAALPALLH